MPICRAGNSGILPPERELGSDNLTVASFDDLNHRGSRPEMGTDASFVYMAELEQIFEADHVEHLFVILTGAMSARRRVWRTELAFGMAAVGL
jgi:hypothetical protein